MIKHQAGTLLVGKIVGGSAGTGIGSPCLAVRGIGIQTPGDCGPCAIKAHVRHILQADALLVRTGLTKRSNPLVGGAVTDPGGAAAMEMDVGTVLGVLRPVVGDRLVRPQAGTHDGFVNREEEITTARNATRGSGIEAIDKLEPDRPILLGDDDRSKIVRSYLAVITAVGINLHIAAQSGRVEVRMHLLFVFHQLDDVVVGTGERALIRHGNRQKLAEVVRSIQTRQGIDELGKRRAVGPVGGRVVIGCAINSIKWPGRYRRNSKGRFRQLRHAADAEQNQKQSKTPQACCSIFHKSSCIATF